MLVTFTKKVNTIHLHLKYFCHTFCTSKLQNKTRQDLLTPKEKKYVKTMNNGDFTCPIKNY